MPVMEIDLGSYVSNISVIKKTIGPDCHLMAVVKSDAYGLGLERIATTAYRCGVRWFGVAAPDEARRLRNAVHDDSIRIVMMLPFVPGDAATIAEAGLIPFISSVGEAEALSEVSLQKGRKTEVHIDVDTGMGRMGFLPGDLAGGLGRLLQLKGISVAGICSHFPSADETGDDFSPSQIEAFLKIAGEAERMLGRKLIKHMANSSALFRYPKARLDIVRSGIISYGVVPSTAVPCEGIRPVVSVKARVVLVKKVSKGQGISYGRTYVAKADSIVAVADMGYGEGLSRVLSSRGQMLVRGRRAPVLGRVTMDMTVIDVTSIPGVSPGDEAVVIGRQGSEEIRVEEVSSAMGTIPYEVFCVMGKILPKQYKE